MRTASALFYSKGIRAVGVEEVLSEAGVTRATLYRHFQGKDDLIATYLRAAHADAQAGVEAAVSSASRAEDQIRAVATSIGSQITSEGFRGCAFLNAAAEFPADEGPALPVVLEHRSWFLQTVTELFARAEAPDPAAAAQHFVMLRDGAMATGCLGAPDEVAAVFYRGIDRMLTVILPPAAE